ncbi:MAG: EcsC family protein [Acidobacteriota bacterium]
MATGDVVSLTDYEQQQVAAIARWKAEEPWAISKAVGLLIEPMASLVRALIPPNVMEGAIQTASTAGEWLSDSQDIVRHGGVSTIADLRGVDLQVCDRLADSVHNWAIGIAVAEGGGTNWSPWGLIPDIPALITIAFRTTYKVGMCYGYPAKSDREKAFVMGVMSAAGSNTVDEKVAATLALRQAAFAVTRRTWTELAEKAAEQRVSTEGGIIAMRQLARQLGISLTKRKALAVIPVIGAIVGGSMNGWFIKDVGWAARRAFQERWLVDNHKIVEVPADVPPASRSGTDSAEPPPVS